eukprot:10185567-Ditylum_brightwellii.AAC.2
MSPNDTVGLLVTSPGQCNKQHWSLHPLLSLISVKAYNLSSMRLVHQVLEPSVTMASNNQIHAAPGSESSSAPTLLRPRDPSAASPASSSYVITDKPLLGYLDFSLGLPLLPSHSKF